MAPIPAPPRPEGLETIPGVGRSIANDLRRLGYRTVSALRAADPERMYRRLSALTRAKQDRCVLYVFRCAVYYASRKRPKPELLLWWNWKDRTFVPRSR